MTTIKLIVGLANPGSEYAQTRHNAGAWYVDALAQCFNQSLKNEAKFFGYTSRINIDGQDVRLLVPTTFMNLSGKAVQAVATFYQIKPEEILVAHDELDLNPGIAKLKLGGAQVDWIMKTSSPRTFSLICTFTSPSLKRLTTMSPSDV